MLWIEHLFDFLYLFCRFRGCLSIEQVVHFLADKKTPASKVGVSRLLGDTGPFALIFNIFFFIIKNVHFYFIKERILHELFNFC